MKEEARSIPILTSLARRVEGYSGLHHAEQDLDLFAEKVSNHARARGFASLPAYDDALRASDRDHAELDRLIDALVVGETYFFRETDGMEALVETMRRRGSSGERLRVWSAACATGEEAITLAILFERAGLLDRVDIVASDISRPSIERARDGLYGRSAHRALSRGLDPWIRIVDGRAAVDERLRARIDWRRINLVDDASIRALGTFDAIVCRNVMIYFAAETVRRVTESLTQALRPDGRLLVGTAESLMRVDAALETDEHAGVFLYKRCAR